MERRWKAGKLEGRLEKYLQEVNNKYCKNKGSLQFQR